MSKFESSVREIPFAQEQVYQMLSDLSNIDRVKDRLPADKIQNLVFDRDSVSIEVPMAGQIAFHIVDREEPKTIKFETVQSPIPLNLWIQLLPLTDASCKMKLTIKTDINPFMAAMVKKPLEEGIEKIADALQLIPYN